MDKFKATHGVSTTPLIFIDDVRIGGFDDLSEYFGNAKKEKDAVTYQSVIALFTVAFVLAIAVTWLVNGVLSNPQTIAWFISIAMVLLGLQKLQDIEKFATMFLNYDLLAQKWVFAFQFLNASCLDAQRRFSLNHAIVCLRCLSASEANFGCLSGNGNPAKSNTHKGDE